MDNSQTNLVAIEWMQWQHAHELATVLSRAGMDPHYDPPYPSGTEGTVGFTPAALYVPAAQAERARELIAQWRTYSDRRVDALAHEVWKQALPYALLMFALALGLSHASGDFVSSASAVFFSFLAAGYWCAYRRRTRRQS